MSKPKQPDNYKITAWPHLRNTVVHACDNQRLHPIYAASEMDFTNAHERIGELRRATRVAVSTHAYVLWCVAQTAAKYPMLHAFRQGKKLITFDSIDVSTIIDQHASDTLRTRLPVVFIVRDADKKSVAQTNWEIREAARSDLSKNPDIAYRRRLTKLPYAVQKIMFRRLLRDPFLHRRFFGSFGFTSTQSPGFDRPLHAFPTNLQSATIAMGNVHQEFRPDENRQPVLRRMMDIAGTFDHDMVDGMLLSRFTYELTKLVESASGLDDEFIRETRELVAHKKS